MKQNTRTTRIFVLLLAAAGLVSNGFAAGPMRCAADAKTEHSASCCDGPARATMAGCNHECCRPQAPKSDSSAPLQSRLAHDRIDAVTGWLVAADLGDALSIVGERHGYSPVVPTSGAPSLVTQHVRLQT